MATNRIFKFMVAFIVLLTGTELYAGFFGQHREGWHWYQDPIAELHPKEDEKMDIGKAPLTPSEQITSYKKALEAKLHKALVYPTLANVKDYQQMQQDFTQRSQQFADTWMQVVYSNPELDHTVVAPVNQKGRHIYLDEQKSIVHETIKNLATHYGLFFFFSSKCKYCHEFAPIVQQFSKNYGWEVMAISADGGTIEGFAAEEDNGLLAKLDVKLLPALFAVNPKTEEILPIAYGLTSLDEMEKRVMALAQNIKGNN